MAKRTFDMSNMQLALPNKEAPPTPPTLPLDTRQILTVPRKHVFAAPDLLPEQRRPRAQPFLTLTATATTAKRLCALKPVAATKLPPISMAFRRLLMTSTPQELALFQTHRFVPELDLWMRLPHTLHKYQLNVISWMQKRTDGGLLCLDMGLGKTVIASAYMLVGTGPVPAETVVARVDSSSSSSSSSPSPHPLLLGCDEKAEGAHDGLNEDDSYSVACLVLVPSPLVSTWMSEVLKFFGKRIRITAHTTKDHLTQADLESFQIVIVTYDQITIMSESSAAFKVRWRTIIADESQRFVNENTSLFKALRGLVSRQKFCLSGTPWNNCSDDIVNQLTFVRTRVPHIKPAPLAESDVIPYIYAMGYTDVGMELPPKYSEVVYVDLDPRSQALYDAIDLADNIDSLVKSMIQRQVAICAWMARKLVEEYNIVPASEAGDVHGFHMWLNDMQGTAGAMSAKMVTLQKLMLQFPDEQELVFSAFTESLEVASTKVGADVNTCQLVNTVPGKARPQIIESFISGVIRILFLTYKLGGVGLNLQNCRLAFLIDRWWTKSSEDQAVTRLHRLGQTRPVTVYSIVTRNTIENHVDKVAHDKGVQSEQLLQAASHARFALDIIDIDDCCDED